MSGRLALALAAVLWAPAAQATTLWGHEGLVTMPAASPLGARELELGARGVLLPTSGAVTGFARYALTEQWEASLVYGVPGHPWPTGAVRYVLVPMIGAQGLGVAMGAAMPGVGLRGPVAGTHVFVVLSRAMGAFGTVHLGFQGDVGLNSRIMVGYEQALGPVRLLAEGFGAQPAAGPYFNLGASFEPVSWLGVDAGSLGVSDRPVLERGYYLGARARTTVPEFWKSLPAPAATPTPTPAPTPRPAATAPPASGTAVPPPPPLPAATLVGRVLAPDGSPRAGYTVRVVGKNGQARTTPTGYFFLPGLGVGAVELEVLDPAGRVVQRTTFRVPEHGPVNLTIQAVAGRRA